MQCQFSAYYKYVTFLLICFSLSVFSQNLLAQTTGTDSLQSALQDTVPPAQNDTLPAAQNDTLPPAAEIQEDDLVQQPGSPRADRQATPDAVNFQASDSLVFNFRDTREGFLYGSARVTQQSNQLTAGKISLFLNRNEVHAQTDTPEDSLSYPVLKRDQQDLKSRRILFNYETEKGKFDAAQVQVDEGHLIGNKVKNVSRQEVFIEDGKYSTCPPTHMYYYIQASRMKVVDEEELFFTNARLYLLDIPYPIVFPFGYVPSGIDRRQSGFLEPTYVFQNTTQRGIGLQNLGWFQYFNDYLVGQTSFDVFTSGSFFNQTRFQYRATDRFDGSVTLGYSMERGLEPTDPDFTESVNKRISVSHSQQFSPYASMSASINLNTANYYQRNSYDIDERARTSSSSNLSYRYRHPENAFNFNVTTRLNQQYATNTTRLTGPETSFSLRQFNPFENTSPAAGEQSWYETISLRYNNNFKSEYSFNPIDQDTATVNWVEALFDPSKFREATGNDQHVRFGFRQQAQASINRLIPSQFLNTSASFNINEYWYPTTIRKELNEEENRVETRKVREFATARDFNTGVNFSTTIYGISQARIRSFEGFRHTLRPSIGFNYSPDFGDDRWGYFREVRTDTASEQTQRYSIFEDEVYGGPRAGEQRSLTFSVNNIFETKRVKRDSTGEVQSENLRLIDNFNISSSYNFAADSLNFSQVRVTLSSRAIQNISIQASASYSLYARDETGREIDRYIWQDSGKYLQPLSYQINLSTQFQGGPHGIQRTSTPMYGPYDPFDQGLFSPVDPRFNQRPVQDFATDWSFSLNFSYSWRYRHGQEAQKSAVLNANNIRFNLTPKWTFNTRLGYDFIEGELTPSQFNLSRRMVCWTLSFQFRPFGDFQYYFFRLSIDSGQIQSLFQKLPLLNNLERSSSPTGRSPRF